MRTASPRRTRRAITSCAVPPIAAKDGHPNTDKVGTCALCLGLGPLCDSHVISEFLYRAMYDDKHRFHVVEAGEQYAPYKQSGYHEPLLCARCEADLSVWETYARGLLLGGVKFQYTREENITWVHGIDYHQFKLFQLSILWRAAVATGDFFSKVQLGPHQERLRVMLLNKDPGEPWEYGCLMIGVHQDGQMQPIIVQPTPARLPDGQGMQFIFGGYFWAYRIASHRSMDRGFLNAILQRSGKLALMFKSLETGGFYQAFLKNHASKLKA